ncbi:hypothetical protein [Anaerospora sp.]|jgi:uncharacterized protein (UPF0335 family)|nr:hypothetical protein [Anaerospora sp.]
MSDRLCNQDDNRLSARVERLEDEVDQLQRQVRELQLLVRQLVAQESCLS